MCLTSRYLLELRKPRPPRRSGIFDGRVEDPVLQGSESVGFALMISGNENRGFSTFNIPNYIKYRASLVPKRTGLKKNHRIAEKFHNIYEIKQLVTDYMPGLTEKDRILWKGKGSLIF